MTPIRTPDSRFEVRLARTDADLRAAERLRYDVFVRELGGDGEGVDHAACLERDAFDPYFDHLLLVDHGAGDRIVGVYRLLRSERMARVGRFYSEDEYDLSPLKSSGRNLLELGRSCLHADYRGGTGMYHLWQGLAAYVETHGIDILFGVASFHGTDVAPVAEALSHLHYDHGASEDLSPRSRVYQPMDLVMREDIDRRSAMRAVPALIKAYLRVGGTVGDGAYIDYAFNTIDICLVMQADQLSARYRDLYNKGRRA